MSALAHLRDQGLHLTASGDTLFVEPRSALTDDLRQLIKQNKPALLRELAVESASRRKAIREAAASHQDALTGSRAALVLGRLHVCCNCDHFDFAADPSALGHCRRFVVEAWPFMPFWCSGFTVSSTPSAPDFQPDLSGALALAKEISR